MAKLGKFIKGALGEIITNRMAPERGALTDLMQMKREKTEPINTNEEQKLKMMGVTKTEPRIVDPNRVIVYQKVIDDIMKKEKNPFDAYEDEEGFEFANKKMGEALKEALEKDDYEDARIFMQDAQIQFENQGFADSEANNFIDSVLEDIFYGDD